jgi:hypothetical protein
MTHTYATAATQHVQAGGTRYAYRRMGTTGRSTKTPCQIFGNGSTAGRHNP